MKKIMIIGANWEQEPLLQKAREMKLYVIATNPYPGAEGFKFSDESYVVNPRDLNGIEAVFKKTQPNAVIADECDYSMFAVAYLTNKYSLPGPRMDSLIITCNKYLERKFAEKGGIPQPKYRLCMTYSQVVEAARKIGFPAIIKPIDNRGSIGVCRIDSEDKLENSFYAAIADSHARQVLIEEYIEGDIQVNMEGIYADKFYNLTFSDKKKYPGACVDMHLHYPGDLPEALLKKLHILNEKLVEAIGIDYGLVHTEFIVKKSQPYLLEIHNRGAGINVSNKIVRAVTGIDTSEVLINYSLGKKVTLKHYSSKKYSVLHFFDFGRGVVSEISGIDSLRKREEVLTLWINFKPGDCLHDIANGPGRHGCVIVAADTLDKGNSLVEEVKNTIKIKFKRPQSN